MVNNIVKLCHLNLEEQIQAGHTSISQVHNLTFRKAKHLAIYRQFIIKKIRNKKSSTSQGSSYLLLHNINNSLKG